MGKWKQSSTHQHIQWSIRQLKTTSNISPSLNTHHIYSKKDKKWTVKTPIVSRRYMMINTPRPITISPGTTLPPLIPNHKAIPLPTQDIMLDDISTSSEDTYILPDLQENQWDINIDDHNKIKEFIDESDYLLISSDGSHNHIGTYAWIISNDKETIIARG